MKTTVQNKTKSWSFFEFLLCHFEDSEQSEGTEGGQSEASGSFVEIDPEHLEDGSRDDDRVETIE
jgi:hypothetical protein